MASQQARFTWMDFYSEFANALLALKDDRQALLGKLDEAYASAGM